MKLHEISSNLYLLIKEFALSLGIKVEANVSQSIKSTIKNIMIRNIICRNYLKDMNLFKSELKQSNGIIIFEIKNENNVLPFIIYYKLMKTLHCSQITFM